MPYFGSGDMLGAWKVPKAVFEGLTAAELQRILSGGTDRGMAGFAAAGPEHLGAIGEVGLVRRQIACGQPARGRQDPEGNAAGACQDQRQTEQLAQHQSVSNELQVIGVLREHGKPAESRQAAAMLEPFRRRDHICGQAGCP